MSFTKQVLYSPAQPRETSFASTVLSWRILTRQTLLALMVSNSRRVETRINKRFRCRTRTSSHGDFHKASLRSGEGGRSWSRSQVRPLGTSRLREPRPHTSVSLNPSPSPAFRPGHIPTAPVLWCDQSSQCGRAQTWQLNPQLNDQTGSVSIWLKSFFRPKYMRFGGKSMHVRVNFSWFNSHLQQFPQILTCL